MMRSRNIKPGLYKDDELAECSIWARYLFPGLWQLADREGRLEDRPKKIKAEIYPFDDCDVDALLWELHNANSIIRYEVKGKRYIWIPNFVRDQNPHKNEKASIIPAHSDSREITGQVPEQHHTNPADSLLLIPERGLPGSGKNPEPSPPQKVGKSLWDEITDKLIDEWTKLYPSRPDPGFIRDIRKKVFQSVSAGQPREAIASALKRIYAGEHILGFGRYVTEYSMPKKDGGTQENTLTKEQLEVKAANARSLAEVYKDDPALAKRYADRAAEYEQQLEKVR